MIWRLRPKNLLSTSTFREIIEKRHKLNYFRIAVSSVVVIEEREREWYTIAAEREKLQRASNNVRINETKCLWLYFVQKSFECCIPYMGKWESCTSPTAVHSWNYHGTMQYTQLICGSFKKRGNLIFPREIWRKSNI